MAGEVLVIYAGMLVQAVAQGHGRSAGRLCRR